ncbi:hypothetical protein [Carnobacterium alterfunditum]|uniref:hypothetical protein n=1 Tax=Carnobacterium alterfunditum TaxID=28230 RepID=UPI003593AEB7
MAKIRRSSLMKYILGVLMFIIYVAADLTMDKMLFPMLTESQKEQHIEIVSKYMILLNLVWVWLVGYILSRHILKKHENKLVKLTTIVFGSALVATVVFSFISLPLIWTAYTFPLLAPICLFFHDYGLFAYFVIMIPILSYRYFKRPSQ